MLAAPQALGIAELLEIILDHLTLGDLLYNAQAVSRFWQNCILNSNSISRRRLLTTNLVDEQDADKLLYLVPIPITDEYKIASIHHQLAQLCDNGNTTIKSIREYVIQDAHQRYSNYTEALGIMYQLVEWKPRIHPNVVTCDWGERVCQLSPDVVHPLVRLGLWIGDGCFWTGYGSHGVLFIEDPPYTRDRYFKTFTQIVSRMLEMVEDCPTASWIGSSIANPAFTTLTLSARREVDRVFPQSVCTETIHRENGATIKDLLVLMADVAFQALEACEDVQIRRIWGNVIRGPHENENGQKAEDKISKVRKKTQPRITAAKDLNRLLITPAT